MQRDISFAYRYWEIVPVDLGPKDPWDDHNQIDQPKPPQRWHRQGFSSEGWSIWGGAQRLENDQVIAREAFSLVWDQRTQQWWVAADDCTRTISKTPDQPEIWRTLYCHHLQDRGQPGLWELVDDGNARQHDSVCPPGFDEFLPENFFMNIAPRQPCHFVGHLSLILGLLAMCPGDINHIPRQIDNLLYHKGQPRFVPWTEYTHKSEVNHTNFPRNKLAYPGRAIVMQTGCIKNDPRSSKERLTYWEQGHMGPMVSSHNPTDMEKHNWRNPNSGY